MSIVGNPKNIVIGNDVSPASGSDVSTIETLVSTADSSGTYAYTDAGGEQTIIEITNTTRKIIQGIWLDLVNITLTGAIKLYYKIDGTNWRLFNTSQFDADVDSDGVYFNLNMGITEDFKVTYTESPGVDEGASRDIPYSIIYETKE